MPSEASKKLVQSLQKIPLFNGMSPSHINKVLGICTRKTFPPGERLCVRGLPSDEMYILLSGQLGILAEGNVQVAVITPVTTVGEMGVITGQPRSATVKVNRESHILVFHKKRFDLLLHDNQDLQVRIYRNIIEILSQKLVTDNIRMRDYLQEKKGYEDCIEEQSRWTEIALELLDEKAGMSPDEIEAYIAEKMEAAGEEESAD